MPPDAIHAEFRNRLVMIGFGSIGQGVLPLLLRHIRMAPSQIVILCADHAGHAEAAEYGIRPRITPITTENIVRMLDPLLSAGDFLLNVSVEVSSTALVEVCQRKGVTYLDTCIEPWPGGYTDPTLTPSLRSNYALRERALKLRQNFPTGPTALITHGANPGLVSHFVKAALLDVAAATGHRAPPPKDRAHWAALAQALGVKAIHVAERDTQVGAAPKQPDEFVNTWSIDGFVGEGCQPAELGWGTHERHFPADGARHDFGSGAAIYLNRPGAGTKVRSWTPLEGPYHGYLITHSEAISIADYFTVAGQYRPTVHYAYHPCDAAVLSLHELAGNNWHLQKTKRLLMSEITDGMDELGVLLMGHAKGAYWYGSRLSIAEARGLAPYNNATSLQVTSAVLAGVVWALENPGRGITEPDEIDHRRIIDLARPYLGELVGVWSDWTPLQDRSRLFPEDLDTADPWQFKNFRVV